MDSQRGQSNKPPETAFITNHLITEQNVQALVKAGRCRWKIENEDINTLKTKGYHFEHNSALTQYLCFDVSIEFVCSHSFVKEPAQ